MKEMPLLFGPETAPLVGTVTTPESDHPAPVACIMLNMGAGYRTGPRRINVKLARQLAQQRVCSLRMDLSGLGDSSAPPGTLGFHEQAVSDLQAAMRQMELMFGIQRFIIIGLCSGGANGLSLAVTDPRVVGLLMFDSYAFPTRYTLFVRDMYRALALAGNPAIYGKTWRWLKTKLRPHGSPVPGIFDDEKPELTRKFFRDAVTELVNRDTAVFMLYSGTVHVRDRQRDQLGTLAAEPFAQGIEYRFVAEIDHGLTDLRSQALFMEMVIDWVMRTVQRRAPGRSHAGPGLPIGAVSRATNDSIFAHLRAARGGASSQPRTP